MVVERRLQSQFGQHLDRAGTYQGSGTCNRCHHWRHGTGSGSNQGIPWSLRCIQCLWWGLEVAASALLAAMPRPYRSRRGGRCRALGATSKWWRWRRIRSPLPCYDHLIRTANRSLQVGASAAGGTGTLLEAQVQQDGSKQFNVGKGNKVSEQNHSLKST